jgi:hypothetical protein
MGVVALALSCGRDNPLYRLVLTLPGFRHFRAPAKFLPWFILAFSLLGGYGLDWLVKRLQSLATRDSLRRHLSWPCVTVFAGLIGLFMVARFLGHERSRDPDVMRDVIRISASFVAVGYITVAICWYALAHQFRRLRGSAFPAGILLLVTADLWLFGHKYVNSSLVPPDTVWRWLAPPPEAGLLQRTEKTEGPFRVAMVGDIPYPNMTIPWHLRGLSGYDPMSLRTTMDFLAASEGWPPDKFVDSVELKQTGSPIYDLFDVCYILTADEVSDPRLELVTQGRYLRIYRRKGAAQAIRWVPEGEVTYRPSSASPRTDQDLLRLSWQRVEIDSQPSEDIRKQKPVEGGEEGRADILFWGEQDIIARYESPCDGWLVLSLPWYPGWRATIEGGTPRACVRAMHALSAVRVPAGEHEVHVSYHPRSWRVGCLVSICTLCASAAAAIWIVVTKRRLQPGHSRLRSRTTFTNRPVRSTD